MKKYIENSVSLSYAARMSRMECIETTPARLYPLNVLLSVAIFTLTCLPPRVVEAANERKIYFYHSDHLGSTNLVTDEQGQVVERVEYAPFGSISVRQGSANVPQKFTGQRLDAGTGLYFYHARYYDPSLGRFIQPDSIVQAPADPQTLNRYAYCRNSPVNYVDPSGHSFWKIFKRVYLALLTLGASETIPQTTKAIASLSEKAGIDPRYPLALYSATLGAFTGGIGWGAGAALSGAVTSFATSLAMDSGAKAVKSPARSPKSSSWMSWG